MRKLIVNRERKSLSLDKAWLDLESVAQVEVSSEEAQRPIEAALVPGSSSGWRAAGPGQQLVRLIFDKPQNLRLIHLVFDEHEQERLQEYTLRWCSGVGQPYREIVRQQYNFSPPTTTTEVEDYKVNLDSCAELELTIVPDLRGSAAHTSIAEFRLA
ncbi:MAG TPA: hypothetical protein VMR88_12790 [Candidatus Polarisedimenticolaceae bacterium]|nr:hypothetical protein [Candidatus Polarisedimenticolaceae bacterium]